MVDAFIREFSVRTVFHVLSIEDFPAALAQEAAFFRGLVQFNHCGWCALSSLKAQCPHRISATAVSFGMGVIDDWALAVHRGLNCPARSQPSLRRFTGAQAVR